ncbi:hypothetical protein ANMWB30_24330 [Arthrobacter sp. MWB30]|nr:hypothetical protein ANMWB30_24330 [Arthrobacter sp. MWB30]
MVYQRKVVSLTLLPPGDFTCPLVDTGGNWHYFAQVEGLFVSTPFAAAWHRVDTMLRSSVSGSRRRSGPCFLGLPGDVGAVPL